METGLVIGKFMPPHTGHIELIRFAAGRCDSLIVLVGARKDEPIPGLLRLEWMRETFSGQGNISVEYTDEELPDSAESSRTVSRVWAEFLRERFPGVSVIFSSETYGDYLAEYMNIRHESFDPERKSVAISGREIRAHPFRYWEFIPEKVRPYFVKKVCVYGPESTGKSVMTEYLARYFSTIFVPEMARVHLGDKEVVESDMPVIAELHAREIMARIPAANKILFVDTDHITTKIYWRHFFGREPEFPAWIHEANSFDLYLLLDVDVPWVADPQRYSENCREEHLSQFRGELDDAGIEYVLVRGSWDERNSTAVKAVLDRWPELI